MRRNIHCIISVFLFFIANSVDANTDEKKLINRSDVHNNAVSTQLLLDTVKPGITFIEQEINYYAPKSGSVNLAWSVENYPIEECLIWNENTKLAYGLMYLPMAAHNDTFSVKLRLPLGSTIQYYFWISKNKQGIYQDFWDLQSSEKITILDALPITKDAKYSVAQKKNYSSILSRGWQLLLLLICVYILFVWAQKKWLSSINKPSNIEKTLFLALSLIFFQALARSEIININLKNIYYDPGIIVKIFRGSLDDLIYAIVLAAIFLVVIKLTKNEKVKSWIYRIFLLLAVFSTWVAFTNITTILFFGKPFSYQWLYYSEFLGSNEARTAIKANISVNIVINLLAISVSLYILSNILFLFYKLIAISKYMKFTMYFILIFGLIILSVKASKTKETWSKGESENAITTMILSMLSPNSGSTLFTMKIPDDDEPFDPKRCIKIDTLAGFNQDKKIKNVLFIILESAGACYFDAFGGNYQLSPNLNKYASQALIFDQMYAHAPVTDRSLVSILASIYPDISYKSLTHEAPNINIPTISSVLKDKGYKTSFFTSSDLRFQNCNDFLANRGFDCVEDFSIIKCNEEFQLDRSDYKEGNGIDDMCLSSRFSSWLDENEPEQNFFSLIWTVQGHYPYFFTQKEEEFGVSEYNLNRYLNCLKYNDKLIGEVIQTLQKRGLDSSTLIVVTGDHGEAFGQHQQYGHGSFIYEEFIHVPLYFINPVLFHGEHKGDIAGMKDLATTALSILNVDIPKTWQGRNLLNTNSNEAFYFASLSDYLFGYRKDQMKFIFNESRKTVEVYDLESDPEEKVNLNNKEMKKEIDYARNQVAAWVQFQNKFIQEIRKKTE